MKPFPSGHKSVNSATREGKNKNYAVQKKYLHILVTYMFQDSLRNLRQPFALYTSIRPSCTPSAKWVMLILQLNVLLLSALLAEEVLKNRARTPSYHRAECKLIYLASCLKNIVFIGLHAALLF